MRTSDLFDFSSSKPRLGRQITSYSKVQYLVGLLIRNRQRQLVSLSKTSDYLNLGCGPEIASNFINIDYLWSPTLDLCWDVTKGLPFPDSSVAGIFTEHMLEHLSLEQARFVTGEMRRVLRSEATVRVVVPDAGLYLDAYAASKSEDAVAIPYARSTDATPLMSVNRIFFEHGHRYLYDYETMRTLLIESGFGQVKREAFMLGRDPILLLDSPSRVVESLYVEATTAL